LKRNPIKTNNPKNNKAKKIIKAALSKIGLWVSKGSMNEVEKISATGILMTAQPNGAIRLMIMIFLVDMLFLSVSTFNVLQAPFAGNLAGDGHILDLSHAYFKVNLKKCGNFV
jgi:hypothetical protein